MLPCQGIKNTVDSFPLKIAEQVFDGQAASHGCMLFAGCLFPHNHNYFLQGSLYHVQGSVSCYKF